MPKGHNFPNPDGTTEKKPGSHGNNEGSARPNWFRGKQISETDRIMPRTNKMGSESIGKGGGNHFEGEK
jgi:hypothetical protein